MIELEIQKITLQISQYSKGRLDAYASGLLLEEVLSAEEAGADEAQILELIHQTLRTEADDPRAEKIMEYIFRDPTRETYQPFNDPKLEALMKSMKE